MRLDRGRFTVVAYPQDLRLARSLLDDAVADDTFPGLPRPAARVLIAIAPDRAHFHGWTGPSAPEWGAAIAIPEEHRIVMQGSRAGSDAGDPAQVLRHELAHLALHEYLGDLPPRWFDEGYASYAAHEWGRDEVLTANLAIALRGMPPLDSLDAGFEGGEARATAAYALSFRAVAELAALDPARGLTLFFRYWRSSGSMDHAVRAAYGLTLAAFEQRWQHETRMRYGGLALVADLSVAGMFLLLVIIPLHVARRQRDRRRLEAMLAADEAEERAERNAVIAELLGELPPARPPRASGAEGDDEARDVP